MRDDVVELGYEEMSPELRALICYEDNGSLEQVNVQDIYARTLRDTPVVRWEFGVGFFGMDDIVAAGRNPAIVSSDPATGRSMGMGSEEPLIPLHVDGEVHRHYRKLLDPLFTPRKMALLEPDIRALADELIDGFPADGRVDLHDAYCVPLPSIIFLKLFGMPIEDMPALIGFKDGIIHCEAESLEERDAKGIAVGHELRALLRERLEERKTSGQRFDDLLDQFLHFEIDGESLSDADVLNIMHLFTIAGLDTVTSSMSCMLSRFVLHPDERRRVMASPELLPSAIEELMRFESPVFSSGVRWATEDTEVNGVPVRAGDLVYLCWATANVDPATFRDPLVVDLERTENRHVAFAAGLHRCLGSHLARNELRVAIDQLHRRLSDYWLQDGETIRYEQKSVRQAHRIPVEFTLAD